MHTDLHTYTSITTHSITFTNMHVLTHLQTYQAFIFTLYTLTAKLTHISQLIYNVHTHERIQWKQYTHAKDYRMLQTHDCTPTHSRIKEGRKKISLHTDIDVHTDIHSPWLKSRFFHTLNFINTDSHFGSYIFIYWLTHILSHILSGLHSRWLTNALIITSTDSHKCCLIHVLTTTYSGC